MCWVEVVGDTDDPVSGGGRLRRVPQPQPPGAQAVETYPRDQGREPGGSLKLAMPDPTQIEIARHTANGLTNPEMRFYKSVWWPAVERANIGDLRFHDLRHTSAALAIAHGAHPKTIQMRLGHHSAAFTLDVYEGLFESLDEDLADRFDEGAAKEKDDEPLDSLHDQEAKVIPFYVLHASYVEVIVERPTGVRAGRAQRTSLVV